MTEKEIFFYAALASKREVCQMAFKCQELVCKHTCSQEGNQDAIDLCITRAVSKEDKPRLVQFKELDFIPFNPTVRQPREYFFTFIIGRKLQDKRTEGLVQAPDGSIFRVTKGAPQVILRLSHNASELREKVEAAVQVRARRDSRYCVLLRRCSKVNIPIAAY